MTTGFLNNRYQILQVLGTAGFGETFLAEDTYLPSRRRCVIKQLKPVTNDPQMYQMVQQRFQRDRFGLEAAMLANLGEGSDQIPKLYAYFCEHGQFYLVQEWIQGQTLTSIVAAEGPLGESAVRQILVSLLSVLDYVHSEGIIHRDIKPDNIIIRESDGKPVLIDFGAVKETMVTVVNSPDKITPPIVIGTPGFMSWEQADGRPVYASDLYSLGLTAIYLLTGKQPPLDTDPQTGGLLWQQHALNVSPNLATVLNQAIQSPPRDRYNTASKMLNALNKSTFTPPEPSNQVTVLLSPTTKTSNQGNWRKALILGILLLAVGLIVRSLLSKTRAPDAPSAPVRGRRGEGETRRHGEFSNNFTVSPCPRVPVSVSTTECNLVSSGTIAAHVPGFPVGTPQSSVRAALGKPTKSSRGLWNTRAMSYENFVPQINLGYLYNPDSGLIRETEAAFAPTLDPQIMVTTLNEMLRGGATEEIKRGLQQVQQRQVDHYSFIKGPLKGIVVRQYCGLIYISVWDADLHELDPAGSRRC